MLTKLFGVEAVTEDLNVSYSVLVKCLKSLEQQKSKKLNKKGIFNIILTQSKAFDSQCTTGRLNILHLNSGLR